MLDVKRGRPVELRVNAPGAVDGDEVAAASALVGGNAKGMRIGVTAGERQSMVIPHGQGCLQTVVIGGVEVSVRVNILEVREFAVEGPGSLQEGVVGGAFVIRLRIGGAKQAFRGRSTRDCRISPRRTEPADKTRLVDFQSAYEFPACVADVADIKGYCRSNGPLDAQAVLVNVWSS